MRPIDGDLLMKTVFNDVVLVDGEVKGVGLILAETVDKAPTIDAVPVVRCRECKYSRINHLMKKDVLSCENIDVCGEEYLFERNPNDFCSYGERKEGADNG